MVTKATSESATDSPAIAQREDSTGVHIALSGAWTTRTIHVVNQQIRQLHELDQGKSIELDLSGLTAIDTAGAWLIERLYASRRRVGARLNIVNAPQAAQTLLAAVEGVNADQHIKKRGQPWLDWRSWFACVGSITVSIGQDFVMAMHILGATVYGSQLKSERRRRINLAPVFYQAQHMGVGAIPIVSLMSFIIGAIIAQQGAYQLRWFGAEILIVDLVGILALREIGVLLAAIMVAGRSGSAITAEIGSMRMREEVDALTVIGLNPVGVLVFPRLVALVVMLPLLAIVADFAALAGGIFIGYVYSSISPEEFIARMRIAIDLTSIFAGLIKAPFMALLIGLIASVEGMKVGGSAESLGRHVTASVVKAIFLVIVVDGFFAVFFVAIDF